MRIRQMKTLPRLTERAHTHMHTHVYMYTHTHAYILIGSQNPSYLEEEHCTTWVLCLKCCERYQGQSLVLVASLILSLGVEFGFDFEKVRKIYISQ